MIYSQKLPNNLKSNLKVTLSDFSKGINTKISENLLPLNYAVNSFNFDFNSGSLTQGLGLKELEIPYYNDLVKKFDTPEGVTKIERFWLFTRYDAGIDGYVPLLMVYSDDKKLYYGRFEGSLTTLVDTGVTFDDMPNCINWRLSDGDNFIACSKNKIVKFDGINQPIEYSEDVPAISSVALYAGRLFATSSGDENILWFSDDLNPMNWKKSQFEGGYIELGGERGRLKKVIESNNYLYIIRDFGITRLTGWGMQSDFVVKNMYLTTGKLYYNSAVLCGNLIMMLCKDGIYCFDGNSMQKINVGLDKFFENVDNSNAVGAFLEGKYYLACRLNYNDDNFVGCENGEYINNTLIEFDLSNGEINISRGVDISYMYAVQAPKISKLVLCVNGENQDKLFELTHNGCVFGVPTHKIWTSPLTDMGYPNYKKVLKSITLNTSSDIDIEINMDNKKYAFLVKGDTNPVRVPLNVIGNKFSITFSCKTENCEISNPQLLVSLC